MLVWRATACGLTLLVAITCATQQAAARAAVIGPCVFFSDLESGPSSGGKNNEGAYVTVWGKRFGNTRGSSFISIGGGRAADYPVWTDSKITFQLGPAAVTGNIVVTTAASASNGAPFTVRPGKVFFVALGGHDDSAGSFSAPWASIVRCKNGLSPGDICYVGDGVRQTSIDDYGASLSINSPGTPGAPKALVAYPGATVTVGADDVEFAIRTPAIAGGRSNWVVSQMHLRGGGTAVDLVGATDWRLIGNDITCPHGNGASACVHTVSSEYLHLYGNKVHDTGTYCEECKLYHAVYFSTDTNHVWAAWNNVSPNLGGCRAIQFYSTSGANQFDLHVHDNVISNARCDGINFATVDPSKGVVEAYNNVVYHTGVRTPADGQGANYACVSTGGSGSGGAVEIYNNTFYDCGARGGGDAGAFSLSISTRLRNNIVRQLTGENYFTQCAECSHVAAGSVSNLFFGLGSAPSWGGLTGSLSADPLFVNPSGGDFQLQNGSPAVGVGASIRGLAWDIDGDRRRQAGVIDLGAY